jgi:hypothetical protein
MSADEVLARLAEQGRMSISDFVLEDSSPTYDKDGNKTGTITTIGLDWTAIRRHGNLIKSITSTQYGPKIELHDGQAALVHIGKHLKLFNDQMDLNLKDSNIVVKLVKDADNAG